MLPYFDSLLHYFILVLNCHSRLTFFSFSPSFFFPILHDCLIFLLLTKFCKY
ncbi:hypothetical protein AtEden1_Chr1g0030481 [Arabidopsis thaliana]